MVRLLSALVCLVLISSATAAERLNVAVTASFRPVLEALQSDFSQQTGIDLQLSSASTGILYQQILNGAPFDIFFAADESRPRELARQLQLPADQLDIYALGELVLVSRVDSVQSVDDLAQYPGKVIMANPRHAPYGVAADQVLNEVGFSGARVQANNVSQARHYLELKLADVGLTAASAVAGLDHIFVVEPDRYAAIKQYRLVLNNSPEVAQLLAFLQSDRAHSELISQGYRLPAADDH